MHHYLNLVGLAPGANDRSEALHLMALAGACAMIVGGWALDAAPAYAGDEPKRGGVLKMARPEEPLSLTGFTISDNGSIWAIEQICDSLIEPDQTGYGLRPAIAESWDISDDGLSIPSRSATPSSPTAIR